MRRRFRTSFLIAIATAQWPAGDLVARAPAAHDVKLQEQRPASCIGIVHPVAEGVEGNASDVEASVRDLLTSDLSSPSLKVVALEARQQSAALEEARAANCGHVLTTTLRRKAGGGAGVLGKMAEGAGRWSAWGIPGGNVGAAAARGAALGGAEAIGSLATATKAKDEMRLEYRLVASSGESVAGPQTEQRKAGSDGEDLVTPLVRRVAERVHAALTNRLG